MLLDLWMDLPKTGPLPVIFCINFSDTEAHTFDSDWLFEHIADRIVELRLENAKQLNVGCLANVSLQSLAALASKYLRRPPGNPVDIPKVTFAS